MAPPAAALTCLMVGFVTAILGFLLTCDYARKETASGFLSPAAGVARVFPPRAGRVVSVHVVEGQEVAAGAPLITVQVGGTNDRGGDVDEAVLQSLAHQRRALTEQIAQEQARTEAESRRLGDRIDELSREIGELQREWKTQDARTRLAEEQVSAVRELVKRGYIPVVEFQRRQDNYLAQRQSEASLAEQIIAKQGEMSQQRHPLAELPGGLATRIATLQASIAELDGRLAETEGRRAYMIRAPIAGHVSALQARPGYRRILPFRSWPSYPPALRCRRSCWCPREPSASSKPVSRCGWPTTRFLSNVSGSTADMSRQCRAPNCGRASWLDRWYCANPPTA